MNSKLIIAFLLASSIGLAQGPPGDLMHESKFQKGAGLSDAQVKQIEAIMKGNRDQMVDLRADLEKKEFRLQDAFEAEPFDADKARSAHSALLKARAALDALRMEQRIALRSEVTLEQFRMLEAMHHHRGRHEDGPGHEGPDRRERFGRMPPPPPAPPAPPAPGN